jgi:hypothetical protein
MEAMLNEMFLLFRVWIAIFLKFKIQNSKIPASRQGGQINPKVSMINILYL